MKNTDKILLETYMWGFEDELKGNVKMWNPNPLLLKAYNIGRKDAYYGDDNSNTDLENAQEIIFKIRNLTYEDSCNW